MLNDKNTDKLSVVSIDSYLKYTFIKTDIFHHFWFYNHSVTIAIAYVLKIHFGHSCHINWKLGPVACRDVGLPGYCSYILWCANTANFNDTIRMWGIVNISCNNDGHPDTTI